MAHDTKNWFVAAGLFLGLGFGLLTYTIFPASVPAFLLIGFGAGLAATKIYSKK